ncbi:zinc finger and SCAN domain-containing protein 22-like [Myxocyprinus asiaticus]|uniref:zinc finger and SCAN domain-containing protein 22-like n=1 Tax=Myxocyprinus asiaticus TaxID=70543 RepID=UPI0022212DE0|nr:zinc finger and SCAN domain-containing protein 22-like [Myxocyprinus asiaticus]
MNMNPHVTVSGGEQRPLVSSCVEEALKAALHRAFEVALEITVNEISTLMGQALRDAYDQIHETQRENITLKLRLQQLQNEQDSTHHTAYSQTDANQSGTTSDIQDEDTPRKVCEKESDEYVVASAEMTCERLNGSFHEIRDDGRVRSHESNTSPINEKETLDSVNDPKMDHKQDVEPSDQDPSSFQPEFEPVKVKTEKPEPEEPLVDGSSGCDSDARPDYSFDPRPNEEFGLDRIAFAQSKLLEDWRTDPEQLQCETESLEQGPSRSLGSSEISLSTPFHSFYQSADKTSLTQSTQNCSDQVRKNIQSSLYVCKFCDHVFHSGIELRNHHIQHHRTILMRVGKATITTRRKKQQLFPPGCSPYHCNVCNRDFNRLENLKTHLRIHTGERPYTCSVCGVRFRHSGALTRHFRIHTGEKPYVCAECGKSFRNCGGLRFHQKSHSLGK